MPTLEELRSQIADLEKQAAEMHQRESAAAIATVVDLVQRYGLTAEQIGLAPTRPAQARTAAKRAATKQARSSRPGAGVPKFADPTSGKTWTGFGKPPAWIAGAADREVFRIDGAGSVAKKVAAKRTNARRSKAGKNE